MRLFRLCPSSFVSCAPFSFVTILSLVWDLIWHIYPPFPTHSHPETKTEPSLMKPVARASIVFRDGEDAADCCWFVGPRDRYPGVGTPFQSHRRPANKQTAVGIASWFIVGVAGVSLDLTGCASHRALNDLWNCTTAESWKGSYGSVLQVCTSLYSTLSSNCCVTGVVNCVTAVVKS